MGPCPPTVPIASGPAKRIRGQCLGQSRSSSEPRLVTSHHTSADGSLRKRSWTLLTFMVISRTRALNERSCYLKSGLSQCHKLDSWKQTDGRDLDLGPRHQRFERGAC